MALIDPDELRQIARKLNTYAGLYAGDKEVRRMSRRCREIADLVSKASLRERSIDLATFGLAHVKLSHGYKVADVEREALADQLIGRIEKFIHELHEEADSDQ